MNDKLDLQSSDFTSLNIEKIAALFPNCVTETAEGKKIDFDLLKQELSTEIVEGNKERYRLEWPGKRESIVAANLPTTKTLRPVREDSVDFDTTENIYIEGDNLEVLKLLQESYLNKIKMIYIDPPYNTGNDFVYKDNFAKAGEEELFESGQKDEYNQRLVANPETNGRYHSDWLSMMYPRLKLARNLLTEDGVIFISIDDNEVHNLRKMCDEIFGDGNFVADLIWSNKEGGGSSDTKYFRIKHEHIICISRNLELTNIIGTSINNEDRYKSTDDHLNERGPYYLQKLGMGSIQYSESLDYPIKTPDGSTVYPKDNNSGKQACWRWSKPKLEWGIGNDFVVIKKDSKDIWTVYTKQYLNCDNEGNIISRTQRPFGVIDSFSSTQASKLLDSLELGNYFSYAKPPELISYLIDRIINKNDSILDFFSGSATTAHSVMQLNAEDGGNRKYIMVQLPEVTDEKSEAYKAGYKNICEIGKERIRRAANKIKEEKIETAKKDGLFADFKDEQDYVFRVYRLDSSNMQDVYYKPQDYNQGTLDLFADNVKEDRTAEDLVTQIMLDWGLPLSLPIERKTISGKEVYAVAGDSLYCCFDDGIDEDFAKAIAQEKPLRIVFRDRGFKDDTAKENVKQLLKQLSGGTEMRVI
ncbi:MAG: site-specific DNA-methyltransferase [Weeksellaceae bacterium]|nr:site-specific DNA-methyltransferase [Weeksellaceae bacterium]